jgi:hypothetical protein
MMGWLPAKPPLEARTTHIIERAGYRIENVLFQSQRDYWIPANLYVPTRAPGPFPAVVLQRGHFDSVRMSPDYQQLYVDLAQNGFAVLSYDSIGQGERRQYYEAGTEEFDEALSPTLEHCAIGGLLSLIGESAAAWFVWDAMRAVDYLATRHEVNPAKIACADHTDTGWSSLYHAALDDRIRCASIHARGNGHRWPIDIASWNTTDDPEQFLFPAAVSGIDFLDILASFAPRPLQVKLEEQSGRFDQTETYVRDQYVRLKAGGKFIVEMAQGGDWPRDLRLATVRWFRQWLQNERGAVVESELQPESYSSLSVTPRGSLRESKIGRPIYSIIRERAAKYPRSLPAAELIEAIRRTISPPTKAPPLDVRELSADRLEGYRLTNVEFLSEPGIFLNARVYQPFRPNGECIVYTTGDVTELHIEVDEELGGAAKPDDDDRAGDAFERAMVEKRYTIVSVDVRGFGSTRPFAPRRDLLGKYEHLHNSDVAVANMAWSLGDSLFAMRVRDLLRSVEYAGQFGHIHLAASDMGALWALFAAAVDSRIASVAIQRGLASYRLPTEHGRYMQATSQFLLGILQRFDLPQVAGAIAPRKLSILDPADHMKQPLAPETARHIYSPVVASYSAGGEFKLIFNERLQDHAAA